MDAACIEAMSQYYRLKQKYEINIAAKKQNILKMKSLTKQERIERFKRIPRQCIHCKAKGGTIFTSTKDRLKAVCGNTASPCNLNIEIFKSICMDSQEELRKYAYDLERYKISIIMAKLDFLFGYKSEEEILSLFEENRLDIAKITDKMFQLEHSINNITNNKENIESIKQLEKIYYDDLKGLKNIYDEYLKDKKPVYLKNMVELYVTKIKPQVTTIRELKYMYTSVEYNEDDDVYRLIELPFTRDKMELFDKKCMVISNVV